MGKRRAFTEYVYMHVSGVHCHSLPLRPSSFQNGRQCGAVVNAEVALTCTSAIQLYQTRRRRRKREKKREKVRKNQRVTVI